jgi:PEGA domain
MVDGEFVGNSPAKLKLKPGKHAVIVKAAGYKDWTREISVPSGSDLLLSATMDK